MTRWIFAALVLANIGLLMWASWYRGDPGSAVSPRPLFHPELMVPISAPGVALKSRRSERSRTPLVPAKPKMRCVAVGPLIPDFAEAAAQWMQSQKYAVERRQEPREVASAYWVHLGPYASRQQAESRMKELSAKGVRDILIMPDPQGRVAISLGLFAQLENAQKRMQELKKRGIDAEQEIRFKTKNLTWIDFRIPEPAEDSIEQLRRHEWGPGAALTDQPCPPDGGEPARTPP